ncbi:MAG: hypothetical protein J6R24_01520, partial [Clostridia bacterium]|nr:hypothetical protein [Clostridia bacterium]
LDEGLNYLKTYIFEKESNGEPVIVFFEDRLTLLVEQAVCQAVGGSFSTSVTTFARFLRYSGKILTKQGSVMSVGKILAENASRLKCLSFHGGVKNGATAVYEMLSQLFASKVSGELLLSSLPEDGLLRDKMYDLALIQDEYEKFLTSNNYVDENRYLSMLPTAIRREKNISQTTVLFFGFSSLTAQALDGVRASCESAKNVLGLFPAGNHEIYAKQAATAFKRTCEEYGEVKLSQLKIPENRMDTAYILRSNLYTPEVFSPTHAQVETDNAVQILQVSDQEAELRFVCGRIKKYIEEGGKYADVTVFLPDVQSYSLLLNKVFGEYGIPYFADLKKSLSTHPFAFFLRSILNAVHDGATPSSVEQIASSCYFGDNGQYRNYLAKFCNYRGGAKREIKEGDVVKDYNREYLIAMRERLLTGMGTFSRKMTGKQFCSAVRKIYTQFSVE